MSKHKENDDGLSGIDRVTKIDALPDDVFNRNYQIIARGAMVEFGKRQSSISKGDFRSLGFVEKNSIGRRYDHRSKENSRGSGQNVGFSFGKLVLRSPNVTELSGFSIVRFRMSSRMFCDASIRSLTQFDNLRSITFEEGVIRLSELTNFLATSSSRGQLGELKVSGMLFPFGYDEELKQRDENLLTSAFGNVSAEQAATNRPQLQLEKLVLDSDELRMFQFLATMDVSRLTTFKVARTYIGLADLITLLNRAVNIENLKFNFRGLCSMNNDGFHLALKKEILKIIGKSETLLSLTFEEFFGWRCRGCLSIGSDMVEMIIKLGRRCRLGKFSLLQHSLCTKEVISAIANNMANLKSLKLRIADYAEESLVQLVTNLVRLEKLSLDKTTRKINSTAAANLTKLKYFEVGIISEESMVMIFQDLGASVSLKKLRVIIGGVDINMATINKWSEGVAPSLETLELVPNFQATAKVINEGLRILVKKFPGLRRLNLRGSNVRDSGLLAISSSLPDLHELDLSYCTKITAEGVQGIVDGCPRLKRLEVKGHGGQFRPRMKLEKYSTMYKD